MSLGWMDSWKISKARITSRLRQECFPRAGDLGFRPCRDKLYQIHFMVRNGVRMPVLGFGLLLEELAVQNLKVVLPKILCSAKKDVLGFGKSIWRFKLGTGELKCASDICDLEQTIFRRLNRRNEFCVGGKKRECFFQQRGERVLPVVIVDFQRIVGVESGCVRNEELDDLLKQWIVDVLLVTEKILVDAEALVSDVRFAQEGHHLIKDSAPLFSGHESVFFLPADQRSGVYAVVFLKAKGGERIVQLADVVRDWYTLVMKDHADHIVARRITVGLEASRLIDENTDFFCSCVHLMLYVAKTKARIAPRLRQETFPRAGDSGFRPCRPVFYQNHAQCRKGVRRIRNYAYDR